MLLNLGLLAAFVVNVVVNATAGSAVSSMSSKYQSLITPAGYAFSIWGLIFAAEAALVIAQLFPKFSSSPLVVSRGVPVFWVLANLAQSGWIFSFSEGKIALSMGLIVGLWLSLFAIVLIHESMAKSGAKENTPWYEFLLLVWPVRLHFAWVTLATILNANLLAVRYEREDAVFLLTTALISVCVIASFTQRLSSNYTLGFVAVWGLAAIASELSDPVDAIEKTFGSTIVDAFHCGAAILAGLVGAATLFNIALDAANDKVVSPRFSDDKTSLMVHK